jgi:hypothetical protein
VGRLVSIVGFHVFPSVPNLLPCSINFRGIGPGVRFPSWSPQHLKPCTDHYPHRASLALWLSMACGSVMEERKAILSFGRWGIGRPCSLWPSFSQASSPSRSHEPGPSSGISLLGKDISTVGSHNTCRSSDVARKSSEDACGPPSGTLGEVAPTSRLPARWRRTRKVASIRPSGYVKHLLLRVHGRPSPLVVN